MIHDSENSFEVDRLIGKECKVPKNYILFIDILLISLYFFYMPTTPPPFFQKKGRALKYLLQKNHTPPPNACNVPGITIIMFFILYNMHNQEGQSEIKVKLNINVINVDLYFSHVHDSNVQRGHVQHRKITYADLEPWWRGSF